MGKNKLMIKKLKRNYQEKKLINNLTRKPPVMNFSRQWEILGKSGSTALPLLILISLTGNYDWLGIIMQCTLNIKKESNKSSECVCTTTHWENYDLYKTWQSHNSKWNIFLKTSEAAFLEPAKKIFRKWIK